MNLLLGKLSNRTLFYFVASVCAMRSPSASAQSCMPPLRLLNRIKTSISGRHSLSGILAGLIVVLCTSANAQLLHRYDFNSTNDTVGTANGTLKGSATISGGALNTTAVAGGLSGGVPQNGLLLPASAVAGIASAFTIETWFVANYGGGFTTLFSFSGNNTANYVLATPARGNSPYASTISVIGGGGSTGEQQASEQYQDNGVLHSMVVTYDGNTLAYYIDGALGSFSGLSPTITDPGLNLSTLTYIGINGGSPYADNSINGSTLDFRIYGQALTAQQVASLYTLGSDASNSSISATIATADTISPVVVDPTTAMTTGTANFATEWNTTGNFENWTFTQASGTVSGGILSGTATGTDSRVILSNFSGGPDLDLGWNDFIELRIQVPSSYTGAIQIFFGTTSYTVSTANGGTTTASTTGFDSSRVVTIPSSSIPKDGAFHTYRIDMGLVQQWRATLRDLRIDPVDGTGTSGMAFAIDYIRVGDDPNATVYQALTTAEMPAAGGTTPSAANRGPNEPVLSMESKHFRFLWNNTATTNGSWTADMPHGTLRNLEETWQVHAKKLGYLDPSLPWGTTAGTRYKLNVSSWYDGYWAGGDGFAGGTVSRLNITPDGLRVDPPTLIIPHELMHCFQFYNNGIGNANKTGYMVGEWYEFHANYGRERWLQQYQNLYPNSSGIDPTYLRCAHQKIDDGRDYYLSWPFFIYLDENPDALPDLGEGTVAKLWQQTQSGEYSMMTLDRLTPTTSLKDIAGYFARRGLTYNYSSKAAIQSSLAAIGQPLDNAATARWQLTDLVQRSDDPTWWRVPYEMAPQQGAYAIHELVVSGSGTSGRTVTVNLRGLPDSARGADWRASFIVIANDGTERYSSLWSSGSNSVTLSATENKLYLSVAGTPAAFYYGGSDDAAYPYRSHPSKTRFPYELQVTGATPRQRDNGATTDLVQHSNGGGYKASGVTVPTTVYIGPNARVLGGTVSGSARIEDYAVVSAGTVNGNAVISGHALVRGGTVTGNAKVRDWALVEEGATVTGSGRVLEHGNVKGSTVVQDIATAKGTAASLSGTLSGNAIIDGNYGDFFSGRNVANGVAFGHVPYVGVPDSHIRALPAGLYAAYDFATAHDSRILDQYGVTDGFTIGSPTWVSADAKRKGFLSFDGTSQFVNLDRSVADLHDFTFTAWVKPLGGVANQAVIWLGASTTKRLCFTPDDGSGHAKFSIINGGSDQTLTASSALTPGVWTHVAVTLNGTNGFLYLNGTSTASSAISIRPDQLLAANTATGLQQNYLAQSGSNAMPMFRGALDDVQFYSIALAASDIAALQPATTAATAGTLYVDLRASDASAGAATWVNNGTLGNFARTGSPSLVSNVVSTGIPGVQFNGTNQAYTSGSNTVADIEGSSDRSIEVWAYNPSLSDEESMVSWAYRGTVRSDMSFNFGSASTYNAVTHWGEDMSWSTLPSTGAWHHLAYTYDGNVTPKIYLDGVLSTTGALSGTLSTFATQPINIACQRDSAGGTRSHYFSGYINSVRVHGGVLTAAQIAVNYNLGPYGAPANAAPTLAAISDQTYVQGNPPVSVSLTIGDSDTAIGSLTLSGSAANTTVVSNGNIAFTGTNALRTATITPATGISGTSAITITVSDGAATASRTFNLSVLTRLDNWRKQYFGANWTTDPNAIDTADPNKDGVTNLMEFFLNRNPVGANNASTLPSVANDGTNLTFTYTRSIAAMSEVTYAVEWSDTLAAGSWSSIGVTESILGNNGTVQNVIATVAVGSSGKRFLRLKVTR